MTREGAVRWLKDMPRKYFHGGDERFDELRKEAIDVAIEALETDVPDIKVGEWISTSKKLPEMDQPVLVWVNGDYWLAELCLLDDVLYWDLYMFELAGEDFNDVVAWMLLPQPYKENEG